MHPDQRPATKATVLYPLEARAQWPVCQVDPNTGESNDERYQLIGGTMTEYDVETESGVLEEL